MPSHIPSIPKGEEKEVVIFFTLEFHARASAYTDRSKEKTFFCDAGGQVPFSVFPPLRPTLLGDPNILCPCCVVRRLRGGGGGGKGSSNTRRGGERVMAAIAKMSGGADGEFWRDYVCVALLFPLALELVKGAFSTAAI